MVDEIRTVTAQIKFKADQQSAEAVKRQLAQLEQFAAKSGDAATKKLAAEAKAAFQSGDMNKALAAMRQLGERAETAAEKYGKLRERVEATKRSMNELRESAEKMAQISTAAIAVGASITAPIILAAKSYVNYAGRADTVSRQWLDSTERISQAQRQVGRVGAQAILPYLEKAADLAEKVAGFAEKNPQAVKTILGIGGALTLVGTLGLAVSKGIQIYANATLISAAALQNTAADKMLQAAGIQAGASGKGIGGAAASAAGGISKVLGAAGIAAAAYGIANTIFEKYKASGQEGMLKEAGKSYGMIFKGVWGMAAKGLGSLTDKIGLTEGATWRWSKAIVELGKKQDDVAQKTEEASPLLPEGAVDAYIAYREAEQQAEEQYNEQRSQIVEQYAEQRVEIEARYEEERTNIVEQYARQRAQAEAELQRNLADLAEDFQEAEKKAYQDYQRERRKAIQDFNREMAQMEADHQKEMRRMEEDYQLEREGAIGSRDALALAEAERNYAREKQRAEEDYRDEKKQRQEEFRRQLAEMDENFRLQREERLADYQERMAELKEQFAEEQVEREAQYKEELEALQEKHKHELTEIEEAKKKALKQLKDQHESERLERRRAFTKQLNALGIFHGDQKKLWDKFYADMADKLQDFIDEMEDKVDGGESDDGGGGGGGGKRGRALGGYVTAGNWRLHNHEFVVNPMTTRMLEAGLGGALTQEKLLYGLLSPFRGGGGGGGGNRFSMNQSVAFNGGKWGENYSEITSAIRQGTEQALNEFLRRIP